MKLFLLDTEFVETFILSFTSTTEVKTAPYIIRSSYCSLNHFSIWVEMSAELAISRTHRVWKHWFHLLQDRALFFLQQLMLMELLLSWSTNVSRVRLLRYPYKQIKEERIGKFSCSYICQLAGSHGKMPLHTFLCAYTVLLFSSLFCFPC